MSDTPILGIPEVGDTQNNKTITINNAIQALEQAGNAGLANTSIGAGPWALTEAQATRNAVFRASGASANFDITLPATIGGNNAKRVFAVRNEDTTYTATVKASSGSGATVALLPGKQGLIWQNYQDMYLLALSASPTGSYDFGTYFNGLPTDNLEIMKLVAVRAFDLAANLAGFRGHVGANPTSTAALTLSKNGSPVATINISTGGVFSCTCSAISVAAGDRLTLNAPSPADATLANIGIMFAGSRAL